MDLAGTFQTFPTHIWWVLALLSLLLTHHDTSQIWNWHIWGTARCIHPHFWSARPLSDCNPKTTRPANYPITNQFALRKRKKISATCLPGFTLSRHCFAAWVVADNLHASCSAHEPYFTYLSFAFNGTACHLHHFQPLPLSFSLILGLNLFSAHDQT